MEQISQALYVSSPHPLDFGGSSLHACSFLLQRPAGNILIHGADAVLPDLDRIEELGGVSRQYLNHAHEASAAINQIRDRFDSMLLVHDADAAATAELATVDHGFTLRHAFEDDLEVVPIPGHTAGATAYYWHGPSSRVLFTGDSVFVTEGRWRAAFLDACGIRDDYVASMETLAELEFDLLAPGFSHRDDPPVIPTDPVDSSRRLLEIADRLRSGGDR